MFKKLITTLLIVGTLFTIGGCTPEKDNALDKIKESGKIVLGTSADYPPYEWHKLVNGKDEIVGFDIEIAKIIAEDLGVDLEIIDMKFEGLLPALVTDDIDFVIAGMVADEQRKKSIDFSTPYYAADHRMVVRLEDKDKFKTPEDLKGLNVGAQKTTKQFEIGEEQFGDSELIGLSKITDLVLELQNNKVDAVILAEPVAIAYETQNTDLFIADIILGAEDGVAIGVNKGQSQLLEALNKTLDRLINDGSIDRLINEAILLSEEN